MRNKQTGQGMVEYIILLFILIIGIFSATIFLKSNPDYAKNSAIVVVYGGCLAGIGWSAKSAIDTLNARARLVVLEVLSENNNTGLTREEINKEISSHYLFKFIPGITFDALAQLSESDKITIENKLFYISKKKQ